MKALHAIGGSLLSSFAILSTYAWWFDVLAVPYNSVALGSGAGRSTPAMLETEAKERKSAHTGVVGALPGVSGVAHGKPREKYGKPLDKRQLLKRYDRAFAEVLTIHGPDSRAEALERLKPIIYELTPDIKAWSGDARLRVYLLLQAIAKDLDNASYSNASLGLLVLILSKGGKCAAEMARPILGEKIRNMYGDPRYEKERFLPRLLLELSDYEPEQVESLAKDAIHGWGDARFSAASGYLGFDELKGRGVRSRVKGLLGGEIAKAGLERDGAALARAITLYHEVR